MTLVVISLLALLFRNLGPLPGALSATMLLGFLLLAAFVAGELARDLRLPRITGYLVIGIALTVLVQAAGIYRNFEDVSSLSLLYDALALVWSGELTDAKSALALVHAAHRVGRLA